MARKRQTQVAPADEAAQNGDGTATVEQPPPPVAANGNGHRRPEISWALNSDRTTRIEVAAWLNTYTTQGGESYEQATFTVSRSYRDQNDQWQRGGSWRNHDLPVLMFLLTKAHTWALDRRTTVNTDTPF